MKKAILIGAILCAFGLNATCNNLPTCCGLPLCETNDSWDIAHIYYAEEVPYNTKALDIYNDISDIQYILRPYKMKDGEYKVTISKVSPTLIKVEEKIDGKTIYLEMKGRNVFDPFTVTNPKPEVTLKVSFDGMICSIEYKSIFDN